MRARIYVRRRTAMQSGKARTKQWVLEYEPEQPRGIDPLMGWTSSSDMRQQVQLEFDTSEEAVAYAEKHGIPYQVFEPHRPARNQNPMRTISGSTVRYPGRIKRSRSSAG